MLTFILSLIGVYVVGFFVILGMVIRERNHFFSGWQQFRMGLILGLIWPYILYEEIRYRRK